MDAFLMWLLLIVLASIWLGVLIEQCAKLVRWYLDRVRR